MKPDPDVFPPLALTGHAPEQPVAPEIPDYLEKVYWWAYLHPNAVRVFEREWLVNLILWGNFKRLRDRALAQLDQGLCKRVLQIACVYGDFTAQLLQRLSPDARLDVVDVAPIQLVNLQRKLAADQRLHLSQQDSAQLHFADDTFDTCLLFFLLHEQPEAVRRATLAEALRITRPGGKIVIVDYHQPHRYHPLRPLMHMILSRLEPFAGDLWWHEIASYLPSGKPPAKVEKTTSFGGLYQQVIISV